MLSIVPVTESLLDSKYPGKTGAWVAEMPPEVPQAVADTVLRQVHAGTVGYNDPTNLESCRTATVQWLHNKYEWAITPEMVGYTPEVVTAYTAALTHMLPPGPIIVPTPSYDPLLSAPGLTSRQVITVPLTASPHGYAMDLERIGHAMQRGARTVVLCHPHNPTGRDYTQQELEALANVVEKNHGRVFADEIHAPLTLTDRRHVPYASTSAAAANHTITATSASKAFNTSGLKCAQLIMTNPRDQKAWAKVAPHYLRGVSRLGVAATITAYTHPSAHTWLKEKVAHLVTNRDRIAHLLAGTPIGYTPPEATYLAWLDMTKVNLANPVEHIAQHAKLALSDGKQYGQPGWARMNFSLPEATLVNAINAMKKALHT